MKAQNYLETKTYQNKGFNIQIRAIQTGALILLIVFLGLSIKTYSDLQQQLSINADQKQQYLDLEQKIQSKIDDIQRTIIENENKNGIIFNNFSNELKNVNGVNDQQKLETDQMKQNGIILNNLQNDLKNAIGVNDQQKLEIDQIKKSNIDNEQNIRMNNQQQISNNDIFKLNLNNLQNIIDNAVSVNAKQQLDIDSLLQSKTDSKQNGRLDILELIQKSEIANIKQNCDQIHSLNIKVEGLFAKIEHSQKNSDQINSVINQLAIQQKDLEILQASINQNRSSEMVSSLDKELELMKLQISFTNKDQSEQFSLVQSKLNAISAEISSLPDLSTIVNNLSLQFPALNKTVTSLDQTINSQTFNKVELKGPYIANHHSNPITLSSTEYRIFPTTEPCIVNLKGKAIISLTAIGLAICSNCEGQLTFLINKQVKVIHNEYNWVYNQYYIQWEWNPVNLTQDYIIEDAGFYEITLGVIQIIGSGATSTLNGMSFTAKITYIS